MAIDIKKTIDRHLKSMKSMQTIFESQIFEMKRAYQKDSTKQIDPDWMDKYTKFTAQLTRTVAEMRNIKKEERLQWDAQKEQDRIDLEFLREEGWISPKEYKERMQDDINQQMMMLIDSLIAVKDEEINGEEPLIEQPFNNKEVASGSNKQ